MDKLLPTTYLGPSFVEECAFCGTPIMFGNMVVLDDILDNWYCNNQCRKEHLLAKPHFMALFEEEKE